MLTNVETFKKFKPDAGRIISICQGYTGKMFGFGSDRQVNGIFILTDDKLHFFKNGVFGNIYHEWPLNAVLDFSFQKGIISTRINFSVDEEVLNLHLSSSWRVCERFLQETWKMLLLRQTESSNLSDHCNERTASRRVMQLLRIHSDLPLEEIFSLSQDQAWEALKEHAPGWYRKEEFVYLYGFDTEDKDYMKERLAEVGVKTTAKLSRKVSLFVISDMADEYCEMSPKKAEKHDSLMTLVDEFGIPTMYEYDLDDIIRKMGRARLLSDHFNEIEVV
jgi:hypothetical protein